MTKWQYIWASVRVGIVALFGVNGLTMSYGAPDLPKLTPLFVFIAVILAVAIGLKVLRMKKPNNQPSKLSWFANPFNDPMNFTHLAGWAFIALGSGEAIRAVAYGYEVGVPVLTLAVGLGIRVGLALVMRMRVNSSTPC